MKRGFIPKRGKMRGRKKRRVAPGRGGYRL
nr:MAG: hypothetical protein [Microvirus sp.]